MSGAESNRNENQGEVPVGSDTVEQQCEPVLPNLKYWVETTQHGGKFGYVIIQQDVNSGTETIMDEGGPYNSKRDAVKAATVFLADNGIAATPG